MFKKIFGKGNGKFRMLPESVGLSVVILIVLFVEAFFIFLMSVLDILPAKFAIAVLLALLLADLGHSNCSTAGNG